MRTAEQEHARFAYLRTREVAAELRVSRTVVIALIQARELEAVDVSVGSRPEWRVPRASLDAFIARRKVA